MLLTVRRTARDPVFPWEILDEAGAPVARVATEALAHTFATTASSAPPHSSDPTPPAREHSAFAVVQDLVTWAEHTGGWDSPVWERARALISTERPTRTYLVRRCKPERAGALLVPAHDSLHAIEAAQALTRVADVPDTCYCVDPYDPDQPAGLADGSWILIDADGHGLFEIQADDEGPLPVGHDDRALALARQQARTGSLLAIEACRLHDRDAPALADKRSLRTALDRIEHVPLTLTLPGAAPEAISWSDFVARNLAVSTTNLAAIAEIVLSGATYHPRGASSAWKLQIDES